MLKGWKHACQCSKCKKITFADNFEIALELEKKTSECCKAKMEYIGFRPEKEHILITPEIDDQEVNADIEENKNDFGNIGSVETFKPVDKVIEDNEEDELATEEIKLETIIDIHRRMSGRYMTDVVREILEENDSQSKNKLAILQSNYPRFFDDALKYIPKFLKSKFDL